MKKLAINIEYKGKQFTSDWKEYNDIEFDLLINIIEKISEGELAYLKFVCGKNSHYFNKKILEESIITIKEFNDEDNSKNIFPSDEELDNLCERYVNRIINGTDYKDHRIHLEFAYKEGFLELVKILKNNNLI